MILYLDASALVKYYIAETGSEQVNRLLRDAHTSATATISCAEIVAAIARAARMGYVLQEGAEHAVSLFNRECTSLIRIPFTEGLVEQAASFAWTRGLRGYDAIHLAAAAIWRDILQTNVTIVTYDCELWRAAREEGFALFPEEW